jgi:hypothetical protein
LTELNVQLELPGPAAAPVPVLPPAAMPDEAHVVGGDDSDGEPQALRGDADEEELADGADAKGLVAAAGPDEP